MQVRSLLVLKRWCAAALCAVAASSGMAQSPAGANAPAVKLRVVGSLADAGQFTKFEEPFWSRRLAELSGGRYGAEVVAFDQAGIRGQEMLSLVQLGAVPIGTVIVTIGSAKDLVLTAPDLAGLNPDIAALRRSVAAARPHLQTLLRERHGVELLGIYTYPAQVLFCRQPLTGIDNLRGRRVRTSSATQSDWVEGLGGTPVVTPFAGILPAFNGGTIDCAITGAMPGHRIGLHEVTTHLYPLAINFGLSVLVANKAAWAAMPADLRTLLQRELPRLEASIWNAAEADMADGIACATGRGACPAGRAGRMQLTPATPQDERRRREVFEQVVLPRWLQRCGPDCGEWWNGALAPVSGITAKTP